MLTQDDATYATLQNILLIQNAKAMCQDVAQDAKALYQDATQDSKALCQDATQDTKALCQDVPKMQKQCDRRLMQPKC